MLHLFKTRASSISASLALLFIDGSSIRDKCLLCACVFCGCLRNELTNPLCEFKCKGELRHVDVFRGACVYKSGSCHENNQNMSFITYFRSHELKSQVNLSNRLLSVYL